VLQRFAERRGSGKNSHDRLPRGARSGDGIYAGIYAGIYDESGDRLHRMIALPTAWREAA